MYEDEKLLFHTWLYHSLLNILQFCTLLIITKRCETTVVVKNSSTGLKTNQIGREGGDDYILDVLQIMRLIQS